MTDQKYASMTYHGMKRLLNGSLLCKTRNCVIPLLHTLTTLDNCSKQSIQTYRQYWPHCLQFSDQHPFDLPLAVQHTLAAQRAVAAVQRLQDITGIE